MAKRNAATSARRQKGRERGRTGSGQRANDGHSRVGQASAASATWSLDPDEGIEALVVSHWFDAGSGDDPYDAVVRVTGRRIGVTGAPKAGDSFTQDDRVEGVVPGSGSITVTSWTYGLNAGEWNVTADLIRPPQPVAAVDSLRVRHGTTTERLARADWAWSRRRISDAAEGPVATRWAVMAPLARIPGVIPGSFPLMGTLAIITALVVQAILVGRAGGAVGSSVAVSVLATLLALIGAKVWFAILHPGPWRQSLLGGWAVDGFLVTAPIVAVLALLIFGLPIGPFLDSVAPGIFFAVAVGRLGCFFTGCCAGRCTRSRFGVWSSDRRIGARRVPAQLIESVTGLVIGVVTTVLVVSGVPGVDGLTFVGALGAYIAVRQALLRVRAERREFSWRRTRVA